MKKRTLVVLMGVMCLITPSAYAQKKLVKGLTEALSSKAPSAVTSAVSAQVERQILTQNTTLNPVYQQALFHARSAAAIRQTGNTGSASTAESSLERLSKRIDQVQQISLENPDLFFDISYSPVRPVTVYTPTRKKNSKNSPRLSPAQWLEGLEIFIQQNHRFPSPYVDSERILYRGVANVMVRLGKNNPIAQRIYELRAQYPRKPRGFPPEYWLEKLENFIQEKGYFPKPSAEGEEKELCKHLYPILSRLPATHPVVQRIEELKLQFKRP